MIQTFRKRVQLVDGVTRIVVSKCDQLAVHNRGGSPAGIPYPYKLQASAVVANGDNIVRFTVREAGGSARLIRDTGGQVGAENIATFSGSAVSVELLAEVFGAGGDAMVTGSVYWGAPDTTLQPFQRKGSVIDRRALSFTQADGDNAITGQAVLGLVQPWTTRVHVDAPSLAGGAAMVPVQVFILGNTPTNQTIPLFDFTVDAATAGGVSRGGRGGADVTPGEFRSVLYQVVGFPAVDGGSSTLSSWETIEP